jgi:Ca-activated chloride channel family protein
MIVRTIVWLLVLTALARPQWLEPPIHRPIPTRDLLLLVDLSGSMDQKDFTNAAGETVDRLTAVKDVLGEFLMRREGDRVGLVVFGTSPFLQVPFTTDLGLCRQLLDETAVRMAGPRTALGDAIGLGIQLFEDSDAPAKTMIALTDGNDTGSAVPPGEAARVAKDREITIHTVAMGDPTTVGEEELDVAALQVVASETEGSFFLAMDRSELAGIYTQLDKIETREVKTVSHRPRNDLYFWPLAAALVISLVACSFKVWMARSVVSTGSGPSARLRVNPRTFELETTE